MSSSASADPGGRVGDPGVASTGVASTGPGERRPQRSDARRNQAQILAAADAVFAELGVGVPVDEVARRAGVGIGTLYRHFPTKEALFEAVIVRHLEQLAEDATALAGAEDPGQALFDFLGRLAEEAASKRDLVDALSGAGIDIKDSASQTKGELEQAAGVLLVRAQQCGAVRPEVSLADLFGLVMGTCLAAGTKTVSCSQARMMTIVCAGLRPDADVDATTAGRARATTGTVGAG